MHEQDAMDRINEVPDNLFWNFDLRQEDIEPEANEWHSIRIKMRELALKAYARNHEAD